MMIKDTNDKVLKKTLVDGEGYEKPNEGAAVVLENVVGTLADGVKQQPASEIRRNSSFHAQRRADPPV